MTTLNPTDTRDFTGWFITVIEGYPFYDIDMIDIDEDESIDNYESDIIDALVEAFPDALVEYKMRRYDNAGTHIYITSPLPGVVNGVHPAETWQTEEAVRSGVQAIMKQVWEDGGFWVELDESTEEREEINYDG